MHDMNAVFILIMSSKNKINIFLFVTVFKLFSKKVFEKKSGQIKLNKSTINIWRRVRSRQASHAVHRVLHL